MIAGTPGARRHCATKAKLRKIELIQEEIDDAHDMFITDTVFQTLREKRRLIPLSAFNIARHLCPSF